MAETLAAAADETPKQPKPVSDDEDDDEDWAVDTSEAAVAARLKAQEEAYNKVHPPTAHPSSYAPQPTTRCGTSPSQPWPQPHPRHRSHTNPDSHAHLDPLHLHPHPTPLSPQQGARIARMQSTLGVALPLHDHPHRSPLTTHHSPLIPQPLPSPSLHSHPHPHPHQVEKANGDRDGEEELDEFELEKRAIGLKIKEV